MRKSEMPQQERSTYVLRAKLHRPALPYDHVLRPRLLLRFANFEHQQLALVTAPAGYGKTTLVCAWIEQVDCPSAWLTLDDEDDDLGVFLMNFVAAIRSIFSDFGDGILAQSHAATLPSIPTIITYVLNEIEQIDEDYVLILDDFHVLTNPDIFALLNGIMHYPIPHFHLVLTSRYELPPQLATLRAQGRMIELSKKDLRFSTAETASFAQQTLPTELAADSIKILVEKTEGWAVGLRLATLAIRRWGTSEYQPSILQVDNPYVIDYLVNEVLARCPAVVHNFLLKSSILDRFCLSLCAALLETDAFDSSILSQLEREGLFIESLDHHKEWYRYHGLFRELLQQRLEKTVSAEEVAALHLRAGNWFAANGFVEESVKHALLSGDTAVAVAIFVPTSYALIENERWLQLENLLNRFPPDVIEESPQLLLLVGWLSLTRMQMGRLETIRQKLEAYEGKENLTAQERRFLDCSINLFAAFKHTWAAESEESIACAQAALSAIEPEWGLLHGYAFVHLGASTHFLHGGRAALATLDNEVTWMGRKSIQVRKLIAVAFVDWLSADMKKLIQTASQGLELISDARRATSSSYLNYFAGAAYYEIDDLDAAAHHFNAVVDQRYSANPYPYVLSCIGQALVYQAQNKVDEAWQMAEMTVDYCLEMSYSRLLFIARTFRADLALRQNQKDVATFWALQAEGIPLTETMPYFYEPAMTLPWIWLAEASPTSLQKAETELQRLHDVVTRTHNIPGQIKVLALKALLYKKQKKARQIEDMLLQAIRLAQLGGLIRIFVDLGPEIETLLKRLYRRGYATAYLKQLVDAFPRTTKVVSSEANLQPYFDTLTERELEILSLLAQRLSNKEIAGALIISEETVKRHTSNIYQKLGVNNRRQAVASAYTFGLLVDTG